MKRPGRTPISTKIEVNKDKIYRANDIFDLATLIFPNKNAKDLRAASILIFLAIKYSQERRLATAEIDKIRKKKCTEISQKTLWKARATMARIGIISRRDRVYWQFSTKFSKSLSYLAEKTEQLMVPIGSREQEEKEWFLLECAKGMKH